MRSKIVATIAMLLVLTTQVEAKDITVKINGEPMELLVEPVIIESYTLVGMREIFQKLGAIVWWDAETATAYARAEGAEVEVKMNSSEAIVNGRTRRMNISARLIDDVAMVPLAFIGEALGYSVSWNEPESEVNLIPPRPRDNPEEFALPEGKLFSLDKSTAELVLGYNEAVEKAVARYSQIQNLENDLERLAELKDEIWDYQIYPAYNTTEGFIAGVRALSQVNYTELDAPLYKQMYSAYAEAALRSSISGIVSQKMDLALLEEDIRLSKFNIENNLELKLQLGLVSENEVIKAKRELEQMQSSLNNLKLAIASDRQTLALMLGFKAGDDVDVRYSPVFTPSNIDIERKVRDIVRDPSIIIKNNALSQAQYEYDTTSWTWERMVSGAPQESKLEKENAVIKARRALEDAKSDMEKGLRSTHNSIKSLEELQKSLELEITKAREDYNTALVNLEAGLITKNQLDFARRSILKAEIDALKNVYRIDDLKFTLDRPYMLSPGA